MMATRQGLMWVVLVIGLLLSAGAAQAGVLTTLDFGTDRVDEGFSVFDPGASCSDSLHRCLKDKTLAFVGHGTIEHVSLTATLSNTFSFSELGLDLQHNGVGVTLVSPLFHLGFGPVTITFDDRAADPLPLTLISGTFRPDFGSRLSVFNGLDASGDWTLTISDYDSGDFSVYSGAILTVTTPEPATFTLLALGLAALGVSRRRRQ